MSTFQKRWDDSHGAVSCVAHWYTYAGRGDATIMGRKREPDKGVDLMLFPFDGRSPIAVDVKHSSTEFTCLDDWPHKGGRFIVNQVSSHRGSITDYYVIVNKGLSHCAIVDVATADNWYKDMVYNKPKQMALECYLAPLDEVWFMPIEAVFYEGDERGGDGQGHGTDYPGYEGPTDRGRAAGDEAGAGGEAAR